MLVMTPHDLRAIYDVLRALKPYKAWKLPPGDKIEFHWVSMAEQGDCTLKNNGTHVVRIAANHHKTFHHVVSTLAHEMVHVHLDKSYPRDKAHHGSRFKRHADIVCRHLGFDRGLF